MRGIRRALFHRAFTSGDLMDEMSMQVDANRVSRRASNALVRVRHAVLHNKTVGSFVGLWLAGLLIAFVLPAPVRVTPQAFELYTQKAQQAESYSGVLSQAQGRMYKQQAILHTEQVCTGRRLRSCTRCSNACAWPHCAQAAARLATEMQSRQRRVMQPPCVSRARASLHALLHFVVHASASCQRLRAQCVCRAGFHGSPRQSAKGASPRSAQS